MNRTPVYLDYASTTPVDPLVAEQMAVCLTMDGSFGNPASRSHRYGWIAEEAVDVARNQIADLINCDPREIVFTSGATESDNLAIKGVIEASEKAKKHVVTVITEHKAVLDTCDYLAQRGVAVTYLQPDAEGLISAQQVADAITDETVLVSVMHVNNEIGVVQDLVAIGQVCRQKQVYFHVDAAQSLGKLPLDLSALPVDLMSLSAHKCYGPKGIGALYVRRRPKVQLAAQMHGGGHERGMRSGTLPTHQIVGFGAACELAGQQLAEEGLRLRHYTELLWDLLSTLDDVYLNGHLTQRVPGIINISFGGVDGESLVMGLNDIAISTGSACTSASMEPSYVLTALGRSAQLAHAGLRFSVGRFTTEDEVRFVAQRVTETVETLRKARMAG
ncbi:IscS subfamily cysteine desulfurase [Alteromonas lipolytica]|uniref:cysteine desulfurase n=1 Tax=Alteromonas lipolytica TaxID=1856405 RepID=A0A1E8FAE8_9ALTE|nr:IscS subfamily cysteine desulfurase [Alteromonas lipolytica]OFI32578.1 IscS subfamily cysteine desulfurase [Alteromonas lipolytica]GGF74945.1 cysteine desulfurase IscS [Alteromonas lipolytica]